MGFLDPWVAAQKARCRDYGLGLYVRVLERKSLPFSTLGALQQKVVE
jgi:hypothetical protein